MKCLPYKKQKIQNKTKQKQKSKNNKQTNKKLTDGAHGSIIKTIEMYPVGGVNGVKFTAVTLAIGNVRKNKQRSTKHTYKTKDRATRTPLKTGCELRCSGRVSSSCSSSGTRRVNLVTNQARARVAQ